jgi:hypothetical protein
MLSKQISNFSSPINNFLHRLPIRALVFLFLGWFFFFTLNLKLLSIGLSTNVPLRFPISIFYGPAIHWSGMPYAAMFGTVLIFSYFFAKKLTPIHLWFLGLTLIIIGNLEQGSVTAAFLDPMHSGYGYIADAYKIEDGVAWLGTFNSEQRSLFMHSAVHPPFAVLTYYFFLALFGNDILVSLSLVFLSSLAVFFVWNIFKNLGVPKENRNILTLIFATLPAINIYSAVSIDGVISATSALFLLGLVSVLYSDKISWFGLFNMSLGLILTNLLTFIGVFLLAVAGIIAILQLIFLRKTDVLIAVFVSVTVSLAVLYALFIFFNYNHIASFLTATNIENPLGFHGFHEPLRYFATRIENISEIAFFLSFGFLAMLFHIDKLNLSIVRWKTNYISVGIAGVAVLVAIFIAGTYQTGETARSAMYIYPYLLLLLTRSDIRVLKDILILASFQTCGMQLFAGYHW